MGSVAGLDTTLEIQVELLSRAKQYASDSCHPLRSVVDEGLRLVLFGETTQAPYVLHNHRFGGPETYDPLVAYTWAELCDIIYGDCFGQT